VGGARVNGWLLRYEGVAPAEEPHRETLCSLGNGRFATRAAAPEARADGVHYPGTYAAGVYNRLVDDVAGHRVENESLVNLPDWQCLTFRILDGDWLDLATVTVLDHLQELDLRRGVLTRRFRIEDGEGRRTSVAQRRLVSMADPYLAALDCTIVAENWTGDLTLRSGLDGRVTNSGVVRYRGLGARHLHVEQAGIRGSLVTLTAETTESRTRVGLAARHRLLVDGEPVSVAGRPRVEQAVAAQEFRVPLAPGRPVVLEKVVALCTSRDRAVGEPGGWARRLATRAPEFDGVLAASVLAWEQLWRHWDVRIDGPAHAALAVRLHVYHLLQTLSPHTADLDVGVPARGLNGEAYRGHVFWDEIFVLPLLSLRLPEVARAMLRYRWRRLPEARRAAADCGRRGAMYPWQSGSTGREETQTMHLNPRSGRWLPDHSHLQRHVGLAVAYNAWRHHEATGDLDFLARHGAEMIMEVARFWADLATYDRAEDRFHICGVMGPDEYHDALPGADRPGLDDNAYSNVMAAWTLTRALSCLDLLPPSRRAELLDGLAIDRSELQHWEHVSRRLRLWWHDDGVLTQFRGYDRLEEFDWTGYRHRYGDISRLDRILEAEDDSTNRYKVSKQADVLMLFQLLTADELYDVLDRLGYPHDRQTIPRAVRYYLDRTSHGSTLSKTVHAWVLARSNRRKAWRYLLDALDSDLTDVQGGTTGEGVHLGAMAGTVDLLVRGFTGIETRHDALGLDPCLPDALHGMSFHVRYRDHPEVQVTVTHDTLRIGGTGDRVATLPVRVRDDDFTVDPRGSLELRLPRRHATGVDDVRPRTPAEEPPAR
jgi:trehalose/maltose hydrolase-like predicted phosphorylase